jgi:hypothetical protein
LKTLSWLPFSDQFQFNVFSFWNEHRLFPFITEAPDFFTAVSNLQVVCRTLSSSSPSQPATGDDVMWRRWNVPSEVECQEVKGDPFLSCDGPGTSLMGCQVCLVESVVRVDVAWSFGRSEGPTASPWKMYALIDGKSDLKYCWARGQPHWRNYWTYYRRRVEASIPLSLLFQDRWNESSRSVELTTIFKMLDRVLEPVCWVVRR